MSDQEPSVQTVDVGPAPSVYQAAPDTREFISTGFADPDPMEPGNWLVPGKAYLDAPPAKKDGFAIIRSEDEKSWEYVIDNRGPIYNTANGYEAYLYDFGAVPAGYTKEPRPDQNYIWVDGAWVFSDAIIANDARIKRDTLLSIVYDRGVFMVQRAIRNTDPTNTTQISYLNGKLVELDDYAKLLQDVPDQAGFPMTIAWPEQPTK